MAFLVIAIGTHTLQTVRAETRVITAGWTLSKNELVQGDMNLNSGTVNLNGFTLHITGNLNQPSGVLNVNGGRLEIDGNYNLYKANDSYFTGNGYLHMVNAADYVKVGGAFTTQTYYDHTGHLIAGTLEVKGNFTQRAGGKYDSYNGWSYITKNFPTGQAYRVIVSGEGPQAVSFANPADSYLGVLEVTNTAPAGLTFSTRVKVTSELRYAPCVCPVANSGNLTLTGAAVIAGDWPYDLTVTENWTLQADQRIGGQLTFVAGTLNLNGHKLCVGGSLYQPTGAVDVHEGRLEIGGDYKLYKANDSYFTGDGYLHMVNADDYVKVGGAFITQTFYNHTGHLVAGTLEVRGSFTQKSGGKYSSYYGWSYINNNFLTGQAYRVILSGEGPQTVSFANPTESFVGSLEIANTSAGITFSTRLKITNNLKYTPYTCPITNSGNLTLTGTAVIDGNWPYDLSITENWTLQADQTIGGQLTFVAGTLNLNGHKLLIGGNLYQPTGAVDVHGGRLEISGDYKLYKANDSYFTGDGYLHMVNDVDYVKVGGAFVNQTFLNHTGHLIAGTLEVKGNLTQKTGGSYSGYWGWSYVKNNFLTSQAYRVVLSGEGPQIVSFDNPTESSLACLMITNTSSQGITLNTRVRVTNSLHYGSTNHCPVVNSSNLTMTGTAVFDGDWPYDLSNTENWTLQANQTIGGQLTFVAGTLNLNGYKLCIGGSLYQPTGAVDVHGGRLEIGGDYKLYRANDQNYSGNGYLHMANPADYVKVGGAFVTQTFCDHTSHLLAGTLEVKGDFTQKTGYSYSGYWGWSYVTNNFLASKAHRVILSGDGLQTVSFANPGPSKMYVLGITKPLTLGYTFTCATPIWFILEERIPAGFIIQRRVGQGPWQFHRYLPAGTTLFVDTDLSPNSAYTYRIIVTNPDGSGPASNEVKIWTPDASGYYINSGITIKADMTEYDSNPVLAIDGKTNTYWITPWRSTFVPGGMVDYFVDNQSGGSWSSSAWVSPSTATPWGVLILTETLFNPPPVPVLTAVPNEVGIGTETLLDGSTSYHLNPLRRIIKFEWDFDADGTYDYAETEDDAADGAFDGMTKHVFATGVDEIGTYTPRLRVTDDDPALPQTAVTSTTVQVTLGNHPPVAVISGPDVIYVGDAAQYSGETSYDEDAENPYLADAIVRYDWEINYLYPYDFDEADTMIIERTWTVPGEYKLGLKVTDKYGATGTTWKTIIVKEPPASADLQPERFMVYRQGEDCRIEVDARNFGLTQSGENWARFYDGDPLAGGVLIGQIRVPALGAGIVEPLTIIWSSPGLGSHRLFAVVDAANEVLEADETNNTIWTIFDFKLPKITVKVSPVEYGPDEEVKPLVTLSDLADLTCVVTVRDTEGRVVTELARFAAPTLSSEQRADYHYHWMTKGFLAGGYLVRGELLHGTQVVAVSEAPFNIHGTFEPAQGLQSSIATDKRYYQAKELVAILGRVANALTNQGYDDIQVKQTVTGPDGSIAAAYVRGISSLPPLDDTTVVNQWDVGANPPGLYHVVQEVQCGEIRQTTETSFTVLSSATAGVTLSGRITAVPAENYYGQSELLQIVVSNEGNTDLMDSLIKVKIVDPDNLAVLAELTTTADLKRQVSMELSMETTITYPVGTYVAVLSVDSAAGPRSLARTTFAVIDSMPPETTITINGPQYSGAKLYVATATRYALTAADDRSGVDYIEAKIDTGDAFRYETEFTLTGEGSHTIAYHAKDRAGNWEDWKTCEVWLDATAPQLTVSTVPPVVAKAGVNYIPPQDEIILAATDAAAGLASWEVSLDGGAFAPASGSFKLTDPGPHTVTQRAADNVQNTSQMTYEVYVDATPPVTTHDYSSPGVWARDPATIGFSATDAESGVSATEVILDGTPLSVPTVKLENAGVHTVRFRSIDAVNNTEDWHEIQVMLDFAPPVTTLAIQGPKYSADRLYVAPATTYTLTATDDRSGVGYIEMRIDGAEPVHYRDAVHLAETGPHTIEYRAVDRAGNVEAWRTLSVYVDGTPPTTTHDYALAGRWSNQPATIHLAAVDEESGVATTEVTLDGTPAACSLQIGTEGVYQIKFRSRDNVDNLEGWREIQAMIDLTPPVVTCNLQEGQEFFADGMIHISYTCADTLSGMAETHAYLDGHEVTGQTAIQPGPGEHVFRVEAMDKAGNVTVLERQILVKIRITITVKPEAMQKNTGRFTVFASLPAGIGTTRIATAVCEGAALESVQAAGDKLVFKFRRDEMTTPFDTIFILRITLDDGTVLEGMDDISKTIVK